MLAFAITSSGAKVCAQAADVLPAGTPISVAVDQNLSSATNHVGDEFRVIVVDNVLVGNSVVVSKGAVGHGRVTFVSKRGGFGKAGMLGLALRDIAIDRNNYLLDGHYQEEGRQRNGTAGAVMFAVGILSIAVHGDEAIVERGRVLRGRTGQAIPVAQPDKSIPAHPPAAGEVPSVSGQGTNGNLSIAPQATG